MKIKQVLLTAILLLVSAAYAQQFEDPKSERIRVSSGVAMGQITHSVDPVYPAEAQKNHIQGDVVMTATISAKGDIINLKLVSGHPLLAQAATEAVKQWKYRPYLLNGEPVEIETTVIVKYRQQSASPRPTHVRVSSGVAEGLKKNDVQ